MAAGYYPDDFGLNVARNVVKGTSHLHKFGAVPALANGSEASVWDAGVLYPWSSFNVANTAVVSIVDDDDNGKTVTVEGLDQNYLFTSEDFVVSNNAVTTGTVEFKRINRAYISAGTDNTANVDITYNSSVVARILATRGQTLMSVYTVPDNCTMYMTKIQASADGSSSLFLKKRFPGQDAFRIAHTGELQGGNYEYEFDVPLSIEARTDIDVRAESKVGSGNARVTAAFCALIIKDGLG